MNNEDILNEQNRLDNSDGIIATPASALGNIFEVKENNKKRPDYFLGLSILIAGVLVSGSLIYNGSRANVNENINDVDNIINEASPEVEDTDIILGDVNAPVTIIEYADYQCPFCERFHEAAGKQIREQYVKSGKVKMIYRDFPFLGQESIVAAEGAHCAGDQGKFWEFHDALYKVESDDSKKNPTNFENNGNITRTLLLSLASSLNLNAGQFSACYDTHKYSDLIKEKQSDGSSKYGVNSTPTFFVNKFKLVGAQPFAQFEAIIEAELRK